MKGAYSGCLLNAPWQPFGKMVYIFLKKLNVSGNQKVEATPMFMGKHNVMYPSTTCNIIPWNN